MEKEKQKETKSLLELASGLSVSAEKLANGMPIGIPLNVAIERLYCGYLTVMAQALEIDESFETRREAAIYLRRVADTLGALGD